MSKLRCLTIPWIVHKPILFVKQYNTFSPPGYVWSIVKCPGLCFGWFLIKFQRLTKNMNNKFFLFSQEKVEDKIDELRSTAFVNFRDGYFGDCL